MSDPTDIANHYRVQDLEDENKRLREAIEIAIHSCGDVTKLGRFSRAVDPVRWVRQLEAHLQAALDIGGRIGTESQGIETSARAPAQPGTAIGTDTSTAAGKMLRPDSSSRQQVEEVPDDFMDEAVEIVRMVEECQEAGKTRTEAIDIIARYLSASFTKDDEAEQESGPSH
jgi:hypothetical protein